MAPVTACLLSSGTPRYTTGFNPIFMATTMKAIVIIVVIMMKVNNHHQDDDDDCLAVAGCC